MHTGDTEDKLSFLEVFADEKNLDAVSAVNFNRMYGR